MGWSLQRRILTSKLCFLRLSRPPRAYDRVPYFLGRMGWTQAGLWMALKVRRHCLRNIVQWLAGAWADPYLTFQLHVLGLLPHRAHRRRYEVPKVLPHRARKRRCESLRVLPHKTHRRPCEESESAPIQSTQKVWGTESAHTQNTQEKVWGSESAPTQSTQETVWGVWKIKTVNLEILSDMTSST